MFHTVTKHSPKSQEPSASVVTAGPAGSLVGGPAGPRSVIDDRLAGT
jgi:hypothetical protein